ncbi:MAG: type II toxin-antitoxin system VapC family toxin [Candidatus Omnitrophica bacterium]|nr:type II toxin-antitoxin system VapC family toxin [Candidatus Omnitrophota bacterium]
MIRVCLDTSAYSRLKRGGENSLQGLLEKADEILVPVTTLGELHAGFHLGSRLHENIQELEEFLAQPGVLVVPITENIAERYGVIVKRLRDQGTPIPTNDIWIAATTLETGARLVAYDRHFHQVSGIIVESP